MAIPPSAVIAIVIFGCAAICLCGYAIWVVMFRDDTDEIDRTRPQGEQVQYMREVRYNGIESFARAAGNHKQSMSVSKFH